MKDHSWLFIPLCILCVHLFITNLDYSSTIHELEDQVELLEEENSTIYGKIEDSYSSGYYDGISEGSDDGFQKGYEEGFSDGVRSNCEGNYEEGFKDGLNSWYSDPYLHETFYEYYEMGVLVGFRYADIVYDIPKFDPDYDLDDILETTWEFILEG